MAMTEQAPGGGRGNSGLAQSLFGRAGKLSEYGDMFLAGGVIAILSVLILPLPIWLLDISLAFSITLSIVVLMTVMFIKRPLELTAFPVILLITTMLRLSLNVATTRIILGNGHEGPDAAGEVIQAFGEFVMSGNLVIGAIVFSILVIINFVVITKGSGRIAEVAARFTLDAMPGKQMAIDADLGAGLIDEGEAKRRRKELEEESAFFGSMDGAAKFVRGDAVAGLLITAVNLIGGILIGVVQQGLPFGAAANTYMILTVGDGLVSQIPALIISTAAGIMVSKAGVEGSPDTALFKQLTNYPRGLAMTAGVMGVMALFPGLPKIPFIVLAAIMGYLAWYLHKRQQTLKAEAEAEQVAQAAAQTAAPAEEPITTALRIDELRLELGFGLLPLINDTRGFRLTDQIKALRRQLATEMGFIMPPVRILDNMQLASNAYVIRVKEVEAGRGDLRVGKLLVMDPRGAPMQIDGEETVEPTFGLPAMWVDEAMREEALFRGYTVVDPGTVITTHLTEVLKDNMADLLSFTETQKLMDELPKETQKLIADLVPGRITVNGIQRVLQNLLAERVSIRDLSTILEAISEACGYTNNLMQITEHVRARLARQISHGNATPDGYIPLVTLSPQWEQAFAESLVGQGEERQLAMAPSRLQEFITGVRQTYERLALEGHMPVLLTSPAIRPYVRSIIERFRPATVVMSQNEIHPKARLRTLAQI